MTVSRWERGVLQPNSYQLALMAEFERAANAKVVRETLGAVLAGAGIAAALYLLLEHSRKQDDASARSRRGPRSSRVVL